MGPAHMWHVLLVIHDVPGLECLRLSHVLPSIAGFEGENETVHKFKGSVDEVSSVVQCNTCTQAR